MADNRLYLFHRPTGKHVMLAKRHGMSWFTYHDTIGPRLNALFDAVESNLDCDFWGNDDFALVLESGELRHDACFVDGDTIEMDRDKMISELPPKDR